MRFLIPILALFSLACEPRTDSPTAPAHRSEVDTLLPLDSLRLWEWQDAWSPAWEVVSVTPLSTRQVPNSRYTGILSVEPGRIEAGYVHWYDWTRGDTLRLDFKVRVRCRRTTIATFEEMRICLRMTEQLPTPLDVTVTVPGETRQYLMARGYRELVRDPEATNPDSGPLIPLEYGRWVRTPTLTQCEDDGVYVRLEIANFLNEHYTPPRPLWLYVELRNRNKLGTVVGKMAVGINAKERK